MLIDPAGARRWSLSDTKLADNILQLVLSGHIAVDLTGILRQLRVSGTSRNPGAFY